METCDGIPKAVVLRSGGMVAIWSRWSAETVLPTSAKTQDLTEALFHEEPPPCAAAEADEEAVPTCTGALSLVLQTVLDDSAARGL